MIVILLTCVICLICSAWIHDIFLISLSLSVIGLCIWILWRFYEMNKETVRSEQMHDMAAREFAERQHQRETLWQDVLTHDYL